MCILASVGINNAPALATKDIAIDKCNPSEITTKYNAQFVELETVEVEVKKDEETVEFHVTNPHVDNQKVLGFCTDTAADPTSLEVLATYQVQTGDGIQGYESESESRDWWVETELPIVKDWLKVKGHYRSQNKREKHPPVNFFKKGDIKVVMKLKPLEGQNKKTAKHAKITVYKYIEKN